MNVNAIEMNSAITGTSPAMSPPRQDHSLPAQVAGEDPVNHEQIRRQVADMQSQISSMNVSLAFTTYGERGEKIAVVVANKETGEVIREIPSKEFQLLRAKMTELTGMILNGQA